MDKILDFFVNYYHFFLDFYNSLDTYGLVVFYGIIICSILIIIVSISIAIKKRNEKYKVVIGETLEEKPEEKEELLIDEKQADIFKMKERLEQNIEQEKDEIKDYEDEQEKTAIISYEEFKRASEAMKEEEPIPVIPYPEVKNKKIELPTRLEEERKKYKRSEFISPINGIERTYNPKHEPNVYKEEEQKEGSLNTEPISKEIHNSEEFLKTLKDFRNSLN